MGASEMMGYSDVSFHKHLISARAVCLPPWAHVSVCMVRMSSFVMRTLRFRGVTDVSKATQVPSSR